MSQKHKKRESSCNSMFQCNKCSRYFTTKSNCEAHKKNCDIEITVLNVENTNSNVDNSSEFVTTLLKTIENRDKQIDELRKKVEMLIEKTSGNTTTNNNTHIENQNVTQNVFIVNNFGNENTEYLTGQIVKNLIKSNAPFACIPRLIQSIHFNPKHPENHNIKVTNTRGKHAKIFKDNKWIRAMKSRTIDDLIETICVFLEEKYDENKDFLSDFRKERFQEFYDKYGDQEKTLMKNIKDEVDVTLINGSNEIHK